VRQHREPVDGDDRPVAAGEVGELLIRGGVVMRGYWGMPEKTAQGFHQRPGVADQPDVFYRTGDLVQRQPDGNYLYLGRKDRQIKTRGYRVELDEIEVALLAHTGVEQAAVYAVPDGQGSHLIQAAVIPRARMDLEAREVMDHLAMPATPMRCPKLTVTDDFPTTGKIDWKALEQQYFPSRNPLTTSEALPASNGKVEYRLRMRVDRRGIESDSTEPCT
jgi:acyl-CoA synthetase (AMP-forming)/AMP-acid ligase II